MKLPQVGDSVEYMVNSTEGIEPVPATIAEVVSPTMVHLDVGGVYEHGVQLLQDDDTAIGRHCRWGPDVTAPAAEDPRDDNTKGDGDDIKSDAQAEADSA